MIAHDDRRRDPREASSDTVKIVGRGGQPAFDAVAVDRSLRGLRVRLDHAPVLPAEVTVLSRATGSIHRARVVWRSAPYAGLSISATIDMRTASGPEAAELRKLWREHIAT